MNKCSCKFSLSYSTFLYTNIYFNPVCFTIVCFDIYNKQQNVKVVLFVQLINIC